MRIKIAVAEKWEVNMKKKWISVFLCVSLLSGMVLTGCTEKTGATDETVQQSVGEEENVGTVEEGASVTQSPMELAIFKG